MNIHIGHYLLFVQSVFGLQQHCQTLKRNNTRPKHDEIKGLFILASSRAICSERWWSEYLAVMRKMANISVLWAKVCRGQWRNMK